MVVREDGRFKMWYSGSDRDGNEFHRIGYAESVDGVNWERLDEPVLSPPDPDVYFSVPAVLRDARGEVLRQNGRLMMWITGHNLMCDLRLCTSEDGIAWRVETPEPISTEVYSPTVIYEDGVYKMCTHTSPTTAQWPSSTPLAGTDWTGPTMGR